jgi:hypothetical protein
MPCSASAPSIAHPRRPTGGPSAKTSSATFLAPRSVRPAPSSMARAYRDPDGQGWR